MIRLDTTTRKLQVVLSGAATTNQLPVIVSWSDATGTAYAGGSSLANTNGATPVDICAAPAVSTVRDVDLIQIRNADTAAATVTVRYNDNGTLYALFSATLAVGDTLHYTHGSGWQVIDSSGKIKFGTFSVAAVAGVLKGDGAGNAVAATAGTDFAGMTANTFSGVQTLPNAVVPRTALGTISVSGTATLNYGTTQYYTATFQSGAATIALAGAPSAGNFSSVLLAATNAGLATLTLPTATWFKGDGTSGSTFASTGVTLQSSGINFFQFWTDGTTTYARSW